MSREYIYQNTSQNIHRVVCMYRVYVQAGKVPILPISERGKARERAREKVMHRRSPTDFPYQTSY